VTWVLAWIVCGLAGTLYVECIGYDENTWVDYLLGITVGFFWIIVIPGHIIYENRIKTNQNRLKSINEDMLSR
jgi:hypothetical protein